MTGRICRHGACRAPIISCGCLIPMLGWRHASDEHHRISAHFCGGDGQSARVAEPEPTPETTLTRFIAALPRLPVVDEEMCGMVGWPTYAELRYQADARWCAFCLVRATCATAATATKLGVTGVRILDLCPAHASDMRHHPEAWDAAQVIGEWETQHRRRPA